MEWLNAKREEHHGHCVHYSFVRYGNDGAAVRLYYMQLLNSISVTVC